MVPSQANTPAANSPCFLPEEPSTGVREFFDWNNGVYGSRCWTLDPQQATACLTPGNSMSNAPGRGAPLSSSQGGGIAPTQVMFLVGDSHSLHLVAGLGSAILGQYSLAYSATLEGAGFNPVFPDVGSNYNCLVDPAWTCRYWKRRHDRYGGPAWVTSARATIEAQAQPGDVITVVNSWLRMPTIEYVNAYMTFLGEIQQLASRRGATLLIMGDVPRLLEEGRNCLHTDTRAQCATNRTRAFRYGWNVQPVTHPSVVYAWQLYAQTEQLMSQFADQYVHVEYIPSSWFFNHLCDPTTGICGPTAPGTDTVIYFDTHHLTTAGSMYLAPFLNCKLRELGVLS